MNIPKIRKAIEATFDIYRSRLDTITEEQFTETPPGGGWSYAEVYSHILQADIGSCVAMERCINGTANPTIGGLNLLGRLVLLFRRFPPVKIKVPEKTGAKMPATKISKEEAKNLLIRCRKRVEDVALLIANATLQDRYKHPRLGNLNAAEWLKFILIHTKHHIRQLDRIEKKFAQS